MVIGYIPHTSASGERRRRRSLISHEHKAEILINPGDKDKPRVWHGEDRIIVVALCRRAKIKNEWRAARKRAEEELLGSVLSNTDVKMVGWLRKLGAGKENDMDNESSWRDRLAFIADGAMYAHKEIAVDAWL